MSLTDVIQQSRLDGAKRNPALCGTVAPYAAWLYTGHMTMAWMRNIRWLSLRDANHCGNECPVQNTLMDVSQKP